MRTKFIYKIFCLISFVSLIYSCSRRDDVRNEMKSMLNSHIRIAHDSLLCINCKEVGFVVPSNSSYRWIEYVDSSECSPCTIDHLSEWKLYLKSKKQLCNIHIQIILESKKDELQQIKAKLIQNNICSPVYIDTSFVFRRHNPQIPNKKMFHTFLLDKTNKVILVGNPVQNMRIDSLFQAIVKK